MDKLNTNIGLRERLDEIDELNYHEVYTPLVNSKLRILIGMWEKGEAIADSTGGKIRSWRELSRQTRRDDKQLKKWYNIYDKNKDKEKYIELAKVKAQLWVDRLLLPKEIKSIETPPLPSDKFSVIYCDPAWPIGSIVLDEFESISSKWESPIDDKYPTMSIEEIKALPVQNISADNCSLFIWTTHTFLSDCLEIINEWGFKYFCTITWNKHSGWTQYGFHKMTEFLLYAYKGKINIEQKGEAIPTLIDEIKSYHSKKPDSIRDLITSKTSGKRLEMFARDIYQGWEAWGNEIKIEINE